MTSIENTDLECGCGCGFSVCSELIRLIGILTEKVGQPLVINSGARCADHNRYIGGPDVSSYTKGLAVEIKCDDSLLRHKIIKEAIELGITRIGISIASIHLDIDKDKVQEVLWMY